MAFRQEIETRLDELQWTNCQLAQKLKGAVPTAAIYDFLSGKSAIDQRHLRKVFDALDMTMPKACRVKDGPGDPQLETQAQRHAP